MKLARKLARKADSFTSEGGLIRQGDCFRIPGDSGTIPRGVANRLQKSLRVGDHTAKWLRAIPTAPSTLFPDFRNWTADGSHEWSWFRCSHQFKGSCWGQEGRQIEPGSN